MNDYFLSDNFSVTSKHSSRAKLSEEVSEEAKDCLEASKMAQVELYETLKRGDDSAPRWSQIQNDFMICKNLSRGGNFKPHVPPPPNRSIIGDLTSSRAHSPPPEPFKVAPQTAYRWAKRIANNLSVLGHSPQARLNTPSETQALERYRDSQKPVDQQMYRYHQVRSQSGRWKSTVWRYGEFVGASRGQVQRAVDDLHEKGERCFWHNVERQLCVNELKSRNRSGEETNDNELIRKLEEEITQGTLKFQQQP